MEMQKDCRCECMGAVVQVCCLMYKGACWLSSNTAGSVLSMPAVCSLHRAADCRVAVAGA